MRKTIEFLISLCICVMVLEIVTTLMMWVLEVGNLRKMATVMSITLIVYFTFRLIHVFMPQERLGVGPKGIIKRVKNKRKFHPSWKDLFDHH